METVFMNTNFTKENTDYYEDEGHRIYCPVEWNITVVYLYTSLNLKNINPAASTWQCRLILERFVNNILEDLHFFDSEMVLKKKISSLKWKLFHTEGVKPSPEKDCPVFNKYMYNVRRLGNLGAHGMAIKATEAEQCIEETFKIIEWIVNCHALNISFLPELQYIIGKCYELGFGVEEDAEESIAWYIKAADNGYVLAQRDLGEAYIRGIYIAKNVEKAKKVLLAAMNNGSSDAKCLYAMLENSNKLLRELSEEGYITGKYNLAQSISNAEEKFDLYKELTENIDCMSKFPIIYSKALYELAVRYYYADGTDKDYSRAFICFKKVAKRGVVKAQYMLGKCYYGGIGVKKNIKEAERWFSAAAHQGNGLAQNELNKLLIELHYEEMI